jgi:protein-S-isoprenylcysteine O-methyltransferase Ste14
MFMGKLVAFLYGIVAYLVFAVVIVYSLGFVSGLVVPKTIDSGPAGPLVESIVINLVLMTIFALQHSVMARPQFKKWWTTIVPKSVERSTYVLFASLALALVFWQWRPIPGVVWEVKEPTIAAFFLYLGLFGWVLVFISTFMINHFELFGLRQVFALWRSRPQAETGFRTTLFYRVVRHPLNLGFIIAFWAAPTMTAGHLLFAGVTTAWILLAMQLEEHDLTAALGASYVAYRKRVPMLVPGLRKRRTDMMVG